MANLNALDILRVEGSLLRATANIQFVKTPRKMIVTACAAQVKESGADMNSYVCLKPLTLSGADYLPGNRIPADEVLPNRVRALKQMGYIAECDAEEKAGYITEEAAEAVFMVPISPVSEDGEHLDGIPATEADVAAMALVLMMTAENASEAIREMENETALRLVQALDSRKSVKNAAAARIRALHPEDAENGGTAEDTGGGDAE